MRAWRKVVAAALATTVLGVIAARVSIRRAVEAFAVEQTLAHARSLAAGLATSEFSRLVARSDEAELLKALLKARESGATDAFVTDRRARVIAHTDISSVGQASRSPDGRLEAALQTGEASWWRAEGGQALEFVWPLTPAAASAEAMLLESAGRSVGALVLRFSLRDALVRAARIAGQACAGFGAAAVLMLGGSLLVLHGLLRAFDRTVETMLDGVLVVGADGRIETLNAAATSLFGGRARDWIGADLSGVVVEAPRILTELRGGRAVLDVEVAVRSSGGRMIDALCAGRPLDPRGRASAYVITLKDMTVRKQLDRLEADRKHEDMHRQFVANVSHEFRTPLAAIRGFADTLLTGGLDDAGNRREFVEIIARHANRLSRLVEDLLQLSVLESDEKRDPTAPIELASFFETVARGAAPIAERAGVRLEFDLQRGLVVEAASDRLEQVLLNLLKNAVEYNHHGGSVKLTVRERAGYAEIAVADTGMGFDAQELPRLFHRFHRSNQAKEMKPEGTGLGLLIVKRIVENHGGTVWAESGQGQGATFFFTLPLGTAAPQRRATASSPV
jgi:PAS domain S-box-containing protein